MVCIATPDRHHAPQAIDAVRAGKDVYCEKPLTHWRQFDLARQLGEEAAKHKRIVQVGTQYVADDAYAEIRKVIADDVIGKMVHVQAGYFRRGDWGERMPIPDANAKPGPDLDWEQFLGDAPKVPFDVSRFFQWRMYWDYAGGPATDLLVHVFTPVFCVLDLDFPERVFGGGGTFEYSREVPDQCNIIARLPRRAERGADELALELRAAEDRHPRHERDHRLAGHRRRREQRRTDRPLRQERAREVHSLARHGRRGKLWSNFLDCVKSRQRPYSPIDIAVRVQAPLEHGHPLASREQSRLVR